MSTVFEIQNRVGELFRLHGTVAPQPQFGEDARRYQHRVLSCAQSLLPPDNAWAQVPLHKQPALALDAIERHIVSDRVSAFKAPVGSLREVNETCPRTGRIVTKFYGDPEDCWGKYKAVTRRVVGITQEGRGRESAVARAHAAKVSAALKAAGL